MTSTDSPAEGSRDVSAPADSNDAPFDDVITLSTSTDDVTAAADDPTGGEGPEERAVHLTDG